jgi:hypothetical protein
MFLNDLLYEYLRLSNFSQNGSDGPAVTKSNGDVTAQQHSTSASLFHSPAQPFAAGESLLPTQNLRFMVGEGWGYVQNEPINEPFAQLYG